jgi:hypothetical protein
MPKPRIPDIDGGRAVSLALEPGAARDTIATAVRYMLQLLADRAPGNTVEVRVPPFGATQIIEGPRHTRGTPPNVVEMDAATWLAIAAGHETWEDALARGRISASGLRASLNGLVPLRYLHESRETIEP